MQKGLLYISFFAIVCSLLATSCKKDNTTNDDDDDNNNNNIDTTSVIIGNRNSQYYLKGLLDGDTLIVGSGSGINNFWGLVTGEESATCTGAGIGYLWQQSAFVNDDEDFVILGFIHCANLGLSATCADDLSGIEIGSYNIGNGEDGEGFYLEYFDENGVKWTTEGDQTGSSVNISPSQFESVSGAAGYNYEVGGSITCKLYNSSGDVMSFTNGTYNVRIGVCND